MPSKAKVSVKYTGNADVREFTAEDFERHGIEQDGVVFNHGNRWVNEVNPEAAGFLIGTNEFEKTTKAEAKLEAEDAEEEDLAVAAQQVPQPGEAVPGEKR